jgi:hypothetical protein
MFALMYLVALSWGYRVARENPKPLNKASGPRVQRYAPGVLKCPSKFDIDLIKRSGLRFPGINQFGGDCDSELARYSIWFQEHLSSGRSS